MDDAEVKNNIKKINSLLKENKNISEKLKLNEVEIEKLSALVYNGTDENLLENRYDIDGEVVTMTKHEKKRYALKKYETKEDAVNTYEVLTAIGYTDFGCNIKINAVSKEVLSSFFDNTPFLKKSVKFDLQHGKVNKGGQFIEDKMKEKNMSKCINCWDERKLKINNKSITIEKTKEKNNE